jgi:membrane protein YqaA with SNARE-associated domain
MTEAEGSRSGAFGGLRRLYDWVLHWVDTPYAIPALFAIAFIESSFFPIPPDALLIALCLGARERAMMFAAVCTVGSVLGGLFGYWIGMSAFSVVGLPILEVYGKVEDFEFYREHFLQEGNLAVFIAALTPVPYKLVTITAGAAGMNVPAFVVVSIIGRGMRFFAVAGLLYWKGDAVAGLIERHFEKLTIAFGVLLVGGFLAFRFLLH